MPLNTPTDQVGIDRFCKINPTLYFIFVSVQVVAIGPTPSNDRWFYVGGWTLSASGPNKTDPNGAKPLRGWAMGPLIPCQLPAFLLPLSRSLILFLLIRARIHPNPGLVPFFPFWLLTPLPWQTLPPTTVLGLWWVGPVMVQTSLSVVRFPVPWFQSRQLIRH